MKLYKVVFWNNAYNELQEREIETTDLDNLLMLLGTYGIYNKDSVLSIKVIPKKEE